MPEPDVDVPVELRLQTDCAICGHHDEFGTIAIALAWYRDAAAPVAVARCLDVEACRARVKGRWPLLERGEAPGSPGPMQPPETTQPDGQEAERDDWI